MGPSSSNENWKLPKQEFKGQMSQYTKTVIDASRSMNSLEDPRNLSEKNIDAYRAMKEKQMKDKFATDYWKKYVDNCLQNEIEVPVDGEDRIIKVYTTIRMTNIGRKLPLMIYAHGGGCCYLTAKDEMPFLCKLADQNDIMFASVDFRNAPECKSPGGAKDFKDAILYFASKGEKHNVDTTKICIGGSGGGANICLTSSILLARQNQSDLIQTQFLWSPMINDYDNQYSLNSQWEYILHGTNKNYYEFMATEYEKQGQDVLLYPGKVSKFTLTTIKNKIIPMVVEFDVNRQDTLDFIQKLQNSEMYVDHSVYAGVHFNFFMDEQCGDLAEQFYRDMHQAFKRYLVEGRSSPNGGNLEIDLEGKMKNDEIEVKQKMKDSKQIKCAVASAILAILVVVILMATLLAPQSKPQCDKITDEKQKEISLFVAKNTDLTNYIRGPAGLSYDQTYQIESLSKLGGYHITQNLTLEFLSPQGLNRQKIQQWIEKTTFKLKKGLCSERGSISWESYKNPGQYIVVQDDGSLGLQVVENGCQSWNACFIATKEADKEKGVVFQPIQSEGSFLSWSEDKALISKDLPENTAWDIKEKDV